MRWVKCSLVLFLLLFLLTFSLGALLSQFLSFALSLSLRRAKERKSKRERESKREVEEGGVDAHLRPPFRIFCCVASFALRPSSASLSLFSDSLSPLRRSLEIRRERERRNDEGDRILRDKRKGGKGMPFFVKSSRTPILYGTRNKRDSSTSLFSIFLSPSSLFSLSLYIFLVLSLSRCSFPRRDTLTLLTREEKGLWSLGQI